MLFPSFNRIGNLLKIVRSAIVDHSNRSGLKAIGELACNSELVKIISVTQFGDELDYVVAVAPGVQPVYRRARKRESKIGKSLIAAGLMPGNQQLYALCVRETGLLQRIPVFSRRLDPYREVKKVTRNLGEARGHNCKAIGRKPDIFAMRPDRPCKVCFGGGSGNLAEKRIVF